MKKKTMLLVIISFVVILTTTNLMRAQEFNFGVYTNLPDNQIDKSKSYFNLLVSPGSSQELTIKLTNDTTDDVLIKPKVNPATTNLNGVVEYSKNPEKLDETAKYNLKDLIDLPSKIKVPSNSEKILTLKLNVPKEKFKGIIAGGIVLEEEKDEKEKINDGLSIKNNYRYIVGVTIQNEKKEVKQNLKLHDVKADQVNSRNVINSNLQNPMPTFINDFHVKASITKKDSKNVLYKVDKEDMQIAPNSNFDFPISSSSSGEKLKPGKYTMKMKANSDSESWEFTKDFTIDKERAKDLNSKDVDVNEHNIWIYIASILLLIVLFVLIFLLIKRKNKEDKNP